MNSFNWTTQSIHFNHNVDDIIRTDLHGELFPDEVALNLIRCINNARSLIINFVLGGRSLPLSVCWCRLHYARTEQLIREYIYREGVELS